MSGDETGQSVLETGDTAVDDPEAEDSDSGSQEAPPPRVQSPSMSSNQNPSKRRGRSREPRLISASKPDQAGHSSRSKSERAPRVEPEPAVVVSPPPPAFIPMDQVAKKVVSTKQLLTEQGDELSSYNPKKIAPPSLLLQQSNSSPTSPKSIQFPLPNTASTASSPLSPRQSISDVIFFVFVARLVPLSQI